MFTAALTAWRRTSCLQAGAARWWWRCQLEGADCAMYVLSYTHRGLLRRSTTWHLISSSSIADALARYAALAEFSADKVLCRRIYSSARFSYSFCHYMHNALKFVVGCIVALFLYSVASYWLWYSCNKITTTQIQIFRQNWNCFFSNINHQMII